MAPWDGRVDPLFRLSLASGMTSLKARLQNDLNVARKAREKLRTQVLSTILADLRYREIDEGGELEEEGVQAVVTKAIKQRKDAAQQMRDRPAGELPDRVPHGVLDARQALDAGFAPLHLQPVQVAVDGEQILEEAEVEILSDYLPPQLSEDEVRGMIRDAIADGADNMGALMGRIMPQLKGRFDGKEANRLVREELGQ